MTAAHGRLCEEHFLIDLNSPGLARPISAAVGMSDLHPGLRMFVSESSWHHLVLIRGVPISLCWHRLKDSRWMRALRCAAEAAVSSVPLDRAPKSEWLPSAAA